MKRFDSVAGLHLYCRQKLEEPLSLASGVASDAVRLGLFADYNADYFYPYDGKPVEISHRAIVNCIAETFEIDVNSDVVLEHDGVLLRWLESGEWAINNSPVSPLQARNWLESNGFEAEALDLFAVDGLVEGAIGQLEMALEIAEETNWQGTRSEAIAQIRGALNLLGSTQFELDGIGIEGDEDAGIGD